MIEKRLIRNLDLPLMSMVAAVMAFGVVIVASATKGYEGRVFGYYVERQLAWILLGWTVMAVILFSDYNAWQRYAGLMYWGSVVMLALVRVPYVGCEILGARRWICLGPVTIQPSEFAKLAILVTLATHLSRKERLESWTDLVSPLVHVGVPWLLVLAQPDLGTSLVFVAILAGMLFMAGAPVGKLTLLFGGGLGAVVAGIWAHVKFGVWLPLKEYQLMRIIVFIKPEMDPLRAGYQIIQSKIAIGSGGIFGKGLFSGTQNQLQFLPEQHTDFIFSVVAEELGLVGATALLFLFFLLLSRAIRIAVQAKDGFGVLLATGVVAMLTFHVFVNVGSTIGMMPVTGIPLPFVSYGGSSMLTNSVAVGMLLNVFMRRQKIMF